MANTRPPRAVSVCFNTQQGYFLASTFTGSVSTLKGLNTWTLPVNGRCTFLGSRHESAQVPPQPNSKVLV
jgi:hypothetical protein